VLLRPLPYGEPDRLVSAGYLLRGEYLLVQERASSFEQVALYEPGVSFNLASSAEPERITGAQRDTKSKYRLVEIRPSRQHVRGSRGGQAGQSL
jgi:hypothetical protein